MSHLCCNHMNEFLRSKLVFQSHEWRIPWEQQASHILLLLFFLSQHHKWLKLASSWFAAIGKNPVERWILPKCSANFLQIPGHNTCATYISFGSEPKQSPYIYHKCLCIYKTTKTSGTFLHSRNFEIEVLDIATKRIQTPESKFNTSNSPEHRQICSTSKAQNIISKHFWAYKTKVLVLYTLLNDKMQIKRLTTQMLENAWFHFPNQQRQKSRSKSWQPKAVWENLISNSYTNKRQIIKTNLRRIKAEKKGSKIHSSHIKVWGGRSCHFLDCIIWHSSIQLCISNLQGSYAISLISNCFRFVHLFSWTNMSLVCFLMQSFPEQNFVLESFWFKILILILTFFSSDRCNFKV